MNAMKHSLICRKIRQGHFEMHGLQNVEKKNIENKSKLNIPKKG